MGIRQRVLIAVTTLAVVGVGFLAVVIPNHMLATLDQVDVEAAEADRDNLRAALDDELDRLAGIAVGGAASSDIRALIHEGVGSGQPTPLLDQIGVDTMGLFTEDGQVRGSFAGLAAPEASHRVWQAVAAARRDGATGSAVRGVVHLPGQHWLVVTTPFRAADGAPAGSLGAAQVLDEVQLRRLGSALPHSPSLEEAAGGITAVEVEDGETLRVRLGVPMVNGHDHALTFVRPRTAHAVGADTARALGWLQGIAGFGGAVAFSLWLDRTVVRRVTRLRREVEGIEARDAAPVTVDPRGDEISDVARAVNQMLQRMGASQRELARRNGELVEANEVRDAFVSMVSHELRTPLTSVVGFTETLLARWDEVPDATRRELLRRVRTHSRTLERLVADLLSLRAASVEADGEVELDVTVDAILGSHFTDDVLADVVAHLRAPGLSAACSEEAIRQVLTNLVTNARKYGAGPIEVSTHRDRDHLVLTVVDHGPGVPPDFVPHLFEPFAQASRGDRRTAQGVGLGLAIVQMHVSSVGGRVGYEDTPGGGATFVVELPVAAVREVAEDGAPAARGDLVEA